MRKLIFILTIIGFLGCDSEDTGDCFQESGEIVKKEIVVADFDEIIVYDKISLFIEKGPQQKVIVESGDNLFNEISAEVQD